MSHIGPAVMFPLGAPGNVRGVLTIGRRHGAPPFPQAQAAFAASFAAQAGVALELAASRAEAERLSLYEDRDRIARDLHDLVIQRLYATGMSLQGTMPMITRPEVAEPDHEGGGRDGRDHQGDPRRDLRAAGPGRRRPSRICAATSSRLVEEMTPMLGFAPSLRLGAGLRGLVSGGLAEQALSRAARGAVQRGQARRRDPGRRDRGRRCDGMLTVLVTDNGTGIPADGRRSGLRNMADRADKFGGELRLGPADPGAPRPGPGWNGAFRSGAQGLRVKKGARRRAALRRAAGHRRRGHRSPGLSRGRSARGR